MVTEAVRVYFFFSLSLSRQLLSQACFVLIFVWLMSILFVKKSGEVYL